MAASGGRCYTLVTTEHGDVYSFDLNADWQLGDCISEPTEGILYAKDDFSEPHLRYQIRRGGGYDGGSFYFYECCRHKLGLPFHVGYWKRTGSQRDSCGARASRHGALWRFTCSHG